MDVLFLESLEVYFVFFILIRKWQLHIKNFNEGSFGRNLLGCSFCFAAWVSIILGYFGIFDLLDFMAIAVLNLFYDILFKKLA